VRPDGSLVPTGHGVHWPQSVSPLKMLRCDRLSRWSTQVCSL